MWCWGQTRVHAYAWRPAACLEPAPHCENAHGGWGVVSKAVATWHSVKLDVYIDHAIIGVYYACKVVAYCGHASDSTAARPEP